MTRDMDDMPYGGDAYTIIEQKDYRKLGYRLLRIGEPIGGSVFQSAIDNRWLTPKPEFADYLYIEGRVPFYIKDTTPKGNPSIPKGKIDVRI